MAPIAPDSAPALLLKTANIRKCTRQLTALHHTIINLYSFCAFFSLPATITAYRADDVSPTASAEPQDGFLDILYELYSIESPPPKCTLEYLTVCSNDV